MKIRQIHIDGSCNNRAGSVLSNVGGVGIVKIGETEVECQSYGPYDRVTSARMEVLGLFLALREITEIVDKIEIYCDNQYVVKAVSENWLFTWVFDYRNCGVLRKHIDLWSNIYDNLIKFKSLGVIIELKWNRGHSGNHYNELADKYATIGRIKGRTVEIIKIKR